MRPWLCFCGVIQGLIESWLSVPLGVYWLLLEERYYNGEGATAIAATMREVSPIAVAAVVVVKTTEVGVPAVLAWQKRTPGEELAQQTGILSKPAALPFSLWYVGARSKVQPSTEHQRAIVACFLAAVQITNTAAVWFANMVTAVFLFYWFGFFYVACLFLSVLAAENKRRLGFFCESPYLCIVLLLYLRFPKKRLILDVSLFVNLDSFVV